MSARRSNRIVLSAGAAWLVCAASSCALAQAPAQPLSVAAMPNYGSGVAAGPLSDSNFNTPESDGRPGVKFFVLAARALKHHDYLHAIDMFKVSASWAYKPAEYNLGLMYFNGEGVPADRALGAAWMILAAERGDAAYVGMRDQMATLLTDAQFAAADKFWGQLKGTYGDKVALRRAKAQWALAKSEKTGSRVGGTSGELYVGSFDMSESPQAQKGGVITSPFALMGSGAVSGTLAYQQLQESTDPYSPKFDKQRTGTVTVEPLQPIKSGTTRSKGDARPSAAAAPPQGV